MACEKKRAFSLMEVMLCVLMLGILAAVSLPRLNYAVIYKQKAQAAARVITTYLRRTRSLAIANAATNTSGFALNMIGSAPYSSYRIVDLSNSATIDTINLDSQIDCIGGNSFQFGPLGNRIGPNTGLTISAQGKSLTINIVSATGIVKCIEN